MDANKRDDERAHLGDAPPKEANPERFAGEARAGEGRGKRRLGMLPEVLPVPTQGLGQGSPRQRTMRTMERLLTAAAASALIGGCSNNKGGGDPGYGVVDPMPPPARCPGVAASIAVKATWTEGQAGLVVELRLSKPGRPDASYAAQETPQVSQGKVINSSVDAGAMVLQIAPDPQAAYVYVNVAATCSEGPAHVAIQLDLTTTSQAPPKAGDAVTFTVNDSY